MGRETLLTVLLLLLGGLAAQPLTLWPLRAQPDEAPRIAERRAWLRLWMPVIPTLLVAAWLCGWALRESDPVNDRFDHGMLVTACLPFAAIALRAALRAAWALVREPTEFPVCTVGLLRPRIVFSPFLARALDEGQIRAAWEHEQAHARHRDPLRIWLAQIVTDVQWPWTGAHERFAAWLEVLECARDDEARSHGASGIDLAAAILATARHGSTAGRLQAAWWPATTEAELLGHAWSLQTRITRLLAPVTDSAGAQAGGRFEDSAAVVLLSAMLVIACALGAVSGERILHPLLLWTWTI